jgi:hypothetical protein
MQTSISAASFSSDVLTCVVPEGHGGSAKCDACAGPATTAAIHSAAVTTNMMRLISASLSVEGRRKKRCKSPPLLASPPSVREAGAPSHPPDGLSLELLGGCYEWRPSENPLKAKFAEL